MAIAKKPARLGEVEKELKSLTKSIKTLSQPNKLGGYTLDTLPGARYELTGGGAEDVEVWEHYDQGDYWTGLPSPYVTDEWGQRVNDPKTGLPQVKEGFRITDEGTATGGYDGQLNYRVEKKRVIKKPIPYEWKLIDEGGEVRPELEASEKKRLADLNKARETEASLSEEKTRLGQQYGYQLAKTVRKSRPGTRKQRTSTLLGNRPRLSTTLGGVKKEK